MVWRISTPHPMMDSRNPCHPKYPRFAVHETSNFASDVRCCHHMVLSLAPALSPATALLSQNPKGLSFDPHSERWNSRYEHILLSRSLMMVEADSLVQCWVHSCSRFAAFGRRSPYLATASWLPWRSWRQWSRHGQNLWVVRFFCR